MSRTWTAKWIGTEKEDAFHPVFQKAFQIKEEIKKATLFITGVGLFEAYINGAKVSDELLTPYLNDYLTGVQYFEFDVTELLNKKSSEAGAARTECPDAYGSDKIEVILGNGWYKGRFGLVPGGNIYGDHFALIAELVLESADGKQTVIASDDSWTYQGSDVEDSGIYEGEIFNRLLWEEKENPEKPAVILDEKVELLDRYSLPVIIKETLPVKEVIHTPAGETVLDFGQNFAGFVSFESEMEKGESIHLEYGEVLQQGNFYNENYKSARGGFRYISDGRKEAVRPHFTYFAGRYVKVSGDLAHLDLKAFAGNVIYSDMERTGYIETSNPKLNRVYENALWSQKCNFIDIPTDCPQRDERLGWTGDINVFTGTASYNMYTKDFLMKFMRDLRAQQVRDGGSVPGFIPSIGWTMVSSVWSDVATFMPWTLYQMYGDIDILEKNYPMMKDWVDYIDRQDAARGERHYLYDFGFHFGDWVALDGSTDHSMKGGTEDFYIASAYYFESSRLVSEAAKVLGKEEDAAYYAELSERIRSAFMDEYYTPNGRLSIDTQAAYVVALRFGLYKDKERVVNAFRLRLKKDCYEIKCGFVGGTYLCKALGENGMEDLAYRFLLNEEYPGWINEVNLGATTIWERWNTILPDGTINPSNMNSCNHYAYGSVVEFLYAIAAGIKPAKPGFAEIALEPVPDKRLREMKCSYKSVHGEIVSNWKATEDGQLQFHFEIPEGTTAILKLPYLPETVNDETVKGKACASGSNIKMEVLAEQQLDPGSYDFSYLPAKDFAHRFDDDSIVKDIAADEEALAVIAETNQPLSFMLRGADKEAATDPLAVFVDNPFTPCSAEEAGQIMERLKQLTF